MSTKQSALTRRQALATAAGASASLLAPSLMAQSPEAVKLAQVLRAVVAGESGAAVTSTPTSTSRR